MTAYATKDDPLKKHVLNEAGLRELVGRRLIVSVPDDVMLERQVGLSRASSGSVKFDGVLSYIGRESLIRRVWNFCPDDRLIETYFVGINGLLVEPREAAIIRAAPFVIQAYLDIPVFYVLQGGEGIQEYGHPHCYRVGELPYDPLEHPAFYGHDGRPMGHERTSKGLAEIYREINRREKERDRKLEYHNYRQKIFMGR